MYLCSTDVRFLHLFLPGTQHLTPDYPKPLPFRQTVQDLMCYEPDFADAVAPGRGRLSLVMRSVIAGSSTEISGRMLDSGSL